uniref:CMP/dCMP-type deaminase domain-containing protein n=1 Tax=Nelumbo nucifera TaxID=4432 RepID=A0A822ZS27_NELNU|nr:TPA_asm: hypothetical protein HUJ06_002878 [Nelumbo nucifera]
MEIFSVTSGSAGLTGHFLYRCCECITNRQREKNPLSPRSPSPPLSRLIGDVAPETRFHFLPQRFDSNDLLDKNVPLLLEPHHNGLTFGDDDHDDGSCINYNKKLKYAVLEAANKSYTPYSGCPSGVALMDTEQKVYKGSYVESAAYNPSLEPVQAVLVAYVVAGGDGGGGYEKIVAGALEGIARLLLQSVLPQCDFVVFHCNLVPSLKI